MVREIDDKGRLQGFKSIGSNKFLFVINLSKNEFLGVKKSSTEFSIKLNEISSSKGTESWDFLEAKIAFLYKI